MEKAQPVSSYSTLYGSDFLFPNCQQPEERQGEPYSMGLKLPVTRCCPYRRNTHIYISPSGVVTKLRRGANDVAKAQIRIRLSDRIMRAVGQDVCLYKRVMTRAGVDFQRMVVDNKVPKWKHIVRIANALDEIAQESFLINSVRR